MIQNKFHYAITGKTAAEIIYDAADHDMRQWLSEHLKLDYTERSNASQFRRAMKEHGRYTPEVRDEVLALETIGYSDYSDFLSR